LNAGEDFVGVGGEEVALGAGEVVLGDGGDLLEETGAGFVVEEPGGEGLRRRGKASARFIGDGLVDHWCDGDGGHWILLGCG